VGVPGREEDEGLYPLNKLGVGCRETRFLPKTWFLSPELLSRYEGFDFTGRLTELHEELEVLNAEAHELEERIAENATRLLSSL
jgi:hypothetical protein